MSTSRSTSEAIFKSLTECNEVNFKKMVNEINNPNIQYNDIPLLHYVIRNTGPHHLSALIEKKVEVDALTKEKNNLRPCTALQWITGLIYPKEYILGWPYNYESSTSPMISVGLKERRMDRFLGSANQIMHEVSTISLNNGATLDFYSACALGNQEYIKNYLSTYPNKINELGPDGSSALIWAARRDQNNTIKLLINAGADVNQVNENKKTAIEETIIHHGSIETLTLLIKNKAHHVRQGIISICEDKFDVIDFLLAQEKKPSDLIIVDDINEASSKVYFDKFLEVLVKNKVCLFNIQQEMLSKGKNLISPWYIQQPDVLRHLIALGFDIHTGEPLASMSDFIIKNDFRSDKLRGLEGMAVLFFHGSKVTLNKPHFLDSLDGLDLVNFLLYFSKEMYLNKQIYAFSKIIEQQSREKLKIKIEEAIKYVNKPDIKNSSSFSVEIKDKKYTLNILNKLNKSCEFPSLMKFCMQNIVANNPNISDNVIDIVKFIKDQSIDKEQKDESKIQLHNYLKENKSVEKTTKRKRIEFFDLPDDSHIKIFKKMNPKDLAKVAPTSREFKTLFLTANPEYAAILRGQKLLKDSKDCPPRIRKVLETQKGFLMLGTNLLDMNEILLHFAREKKRIDEFKNFEAYRMGYGDEALNPARYIELLLSDHGIKALKEHLLPKNILTISPSAEQIPWDLHGGFYSGLTTVLSNNGLMALKEKLLTFEQLLNFPFNIIYLKDLFSDKGIAALRAGLDISSIRDVQSLLTLISHPNGITALRERLITSAQIRDLTSMDLLEALSDELLERARRAQRSSLSAP